MNAFAETTNPRANRDAQVGIVLVSTLVFGGLVFLVRKSPTSGLWSFFFYKELPTWLRLSSVLSPAILTVAACYLVRKVSHSTTLLEPHRIQPFVLLCGVFVISLGLFWLLREHRYWGDATGTIEILEGESDVKALGVYFWKEPLDRLLAVLSYDTLHTLGNWGAAQSVALMSCLAGGVFVAALFALAARLGRTLYDRFFIIAFTLSMGAVQLFFGHVENYTLVTLTMLLFMLASVRYLEGVGPLFVAGLLAAIAVAVHPLAVFLLPALMSLPFIRTPREPWKNIFLAVLPGFAFLAGFYVICRLLGAPQIVIGFNQYGDDRSVFLPVLQALEYRHVRDVIQGLLLILPLGVWVIGLDLVRTRPGVHRDPIALFLFINSLSFLAYALFFNQKLDRLMDWDLFAPAALPVALTVGYLYASLRPDGSAKRRIGLYAILFSLAFTVPWVLSNYSANQPLLK
jgi:hypothetical protein